MQPSSENSPEQSLKLSEDEIPPDVLLGALMHSDLLEEVQRATSAAQAATALAQQLSTWAERLSPYFERDARLTVASALAPYDEDRASRA